MLEHGRDRYGQIESPAFVSTLDLRTLRMPAATSESTTRLYSRYFRAEDYSTSANPMYHIDLYQLLFALTELSGDKKYRDAGEKAIDWFFHNTQSPATGLLPWGEHLGWDLIGDRIAVGSVRSDGKFHVSDTHEFYGPWLHWDVTWKVASEPSLRFATGLWQHQIYDHRTCEFSRHASYSKHGPRKGYEFARQAGFYLDTWATSYEKSRDPELIEAIRRMVAAYGRWRNPGSGLIPFETRSPDVIFVLHNLSFMVDGWRASQRLPGEERETLQALIRLLDDGILKLKQDLSPDGEGFAKIADAATGEVTNRGMAKARPGYSMEFINQRYWPWGGKWASMYGAGSYTDARHGLLCFLRWQQIRRDEYRTLVLNVADRYLDASPDTKEKELTGKTLAPVMAILHAAYRLSADGKYLRKSESLAELAIEHLFEDGVAFPYATQWRQRYPYYASISYGDSLMLMFLDLALLRNGRSEDAERLALECSIR